MHVVKPNYLAGCQYTRLVGYLTSLHYNKNMFYQLAILQSIVCALCIQVSVQEREDRIAELEEFINDQVAELKGMEGTLLENKNSKLALEREYDLASQRIEVIEYVALLL